MTTIGIGMTTRNRPEILQQALTAHVRYLPPDTTALYVHDDGDGGDLSERIEPRNWASGRTTVVTPPRRPVGIAQAKNTLIRHLLDEGCEHLFLFDDDTWPCAHGWERPFLDHPEGHLQYNWVESNEHNANLTELYRDAQTVAYDRSRGVLLYFHRSVLDRVGGMDPAYQLGFEHVELSERIRNAGLTTWAHQSPAGTGSDAIYAMDAHETVQSSITPVQRRLHATPNLVLLESHRGRTDYVSYLPRHHKVITTLFTGVTDTQRGRRPWEPNAAIAQRLLLSLGHTTKPRPWAIDYVVLHNEALKNLPGDEVDQALHWRKVGFPANDLMSVYVYRWVAVRQYLVRNPHVEKMWVVDCSDVEYLQRGRDPFERVGEGKLYIGYEPQIAGTPWMIENHDASAPWLLKHRNNTLYNAGVLGGDRTTIMKFIDAILDAHRKAVVSSKKDQAGDMGYIQQAVAAMDVPVVSGPAIVSLFKGYQHDADAIWRHK